ncbi:Serine/threonine-protein kinase MRCK alpha [Physocladia obscura]|uniref:non-specific serine/threonine protein kinase n=1 Tax=Physocladia obscura TaxID=109957 RepID=A0AAD5T871_9FUNG|nr:Serine/threonine-protein kinase MRCK alpha [Physocladia obscura]
MEERNALVFAQDSRWITTLYAAFQDDDNLYLIMEYVPGGSLRNLLDNRETTLSEEEARFYIAEIILALEEVHRLHDLKPDNVLIDSTGHLKLGDFGSCIRIGDSTQINSHETVGTPDYISPEILRAHEGNASYGVEIRWSLGVMLYEMLFDEVPFYSESLVETYAKIMDHEKSFEFPKDTEISDTARDFINRADIRIGKLGGLQDLKSHPWFKGLSFEQMFLAIPPFIPELNGPQDTKYFTDEEGSEAKKYSKKPIQKTRDFLGQNLPFIGYSYLQNTTPAINWKISTQIHENTDRAESFENNPTPTAIYLSQEKIEYLAKSVADSLEKSEKLQKTIENLEEVNKRLELDLRRTQALTIKEESEKEDLQTRLTTLRRSRNEAEGLLKMQLQSLVEEKQELANETAELNLKIDGMKLNLYEKENEVLDLEKNRNFLEKKIDCFTRRIIEESGTSNAINLKFEEAARQLSHETKIRTNSDFEKDQYIQKYQELLKQLSLSESALQMQKNKFNTVVLTLHELEKLKSIADLELKTCKMELQEMRSPTDKNCDLDNLQNQISSLITQRENYLEELAAMTKSNAVLELEVSELSEKLFKERDVCQDLKIELTAKETQISIEQARNLKLANQISGFQLKKLEDEKIIVALKNEIENLKKSLEVKGFFEETQLFDARTRLAEVKESLNTQSTKIHDLQNLLSDERLAHNSTDLKLKEESFHRLDLFEKVQSLLQQLNSKEKKYSEEILELQIFNTKLQKENKELRSENVTVLKEKIFEDAQTISELEQRLKKKQSCIMELETQVSFNNLTKLNLQNRMSELETWTISLQEELDQSRVNAIKCVKNSPKTSAVEIKSEKNLHGLRNIFFRSQQQKEDQEKAFKRLSQAESEIRGHIHQYVDFDFDSSYVLRGYLKIPKDGRVKRGWKQKYAIVKNFKIYIFDREKDSETTEGILIADIRSDVFFAKPVRQNELIHTSAKQIDCIFKVQSSFHDKSDKNHSKTYSSFDMTKNIEKLEKAIQDEEQIQHAVEKMMQAVTEESHKQSFYSQLEASQKKISKMVCELQRLEDCVNSAPKNALTENSDEPSLEEEILRAKKLVQRQIDEEVIKRENLKKNLSGISSTKIQNMTKGKKSAKDEITASEIIIQNLTAEKSTLDGQNEKLKKATVQKILNSESINNGHILKPRQYHQINQPIACAYCQDALWGGQILECIKCKIQCHNSCSNLIEISCDEVNALKEIPSLFFINHLKNVRDGFLLLNFSEMN